MTIVKNSNKTSIYIYQAAKQYRYYTVINNQCLCVLLWRLTRKLDTVPCEGSKSYYEQDFFL